MINHDQLLDIIYIFFYSAACAIYLPLPSEAPMFLFPRLHRVTVLLICALGKGCGAALVFATGDRFRQTRFFNHVMDVLHAKAIWLKLSAWMEQIMKKWGFWGFVLLMAVPGMPMRSAIYSVSFVRINGAKFVGGVMIGTIVRNSLVYLGYVSIRSIFI